MGGGGGVALFRLALHFIHLNMGGFGGLTARKKLQQRQGWGGVGG